MLYSTSIAHELNRIIYGYRRDGFLETVGPAGMAIRTLPAVILTLLIFYTTGLNGLTQMFVDFLEFLSPSELICGLQNIRPCGSTLCSGTCREYSDTHFM